jgi:dTDP-4-amino-4,6-dideoxygalactose transaminase
MDAILEFAAKHGLPVIEDAAQAHGSEYKNRKAGSMGRAGCFSFYPAKNLGAFGEGGAVVTSDGDLAERLRALRNHGQFRKNHHALMGWNCRMDGIQAAVLRVKLRHLDEDNLLRRNHARRYDSAFAGFPEVVPPQAAPERLHNHHIYAIRVRQRRRMLDELARKGIGCAVHYPVPVHLQPACADLGYRRGDFPVAERCAEEFISLPIFPELTPARIDLVIEAIGEALGACAAV